MPPVGTPRSAAGPGGDRWTSRAARRRSAGTPGTGLLAQFEIDEGLGGADRGNGPYPADYVQQVLVVLADDLHHEIHRSRGQRHVADLLDGGQLVGHRLQVALALHADHGLSPETEGERIGHRDDLHHARIDEALNALADGGLRQPHRLPDRGVRLAPVLPQLLDDLLGDVVEYDGTLRPWPA